MKRALAVAVLLLFAAVAKAQERFTDMWWAGSAQNGWGMSIVQHGDKLFSVIFAYDATGRPEWYVQPAGSWNAEGSTWTGRLYVPQGSPWFAYDASRFVVGASVGQASIAFTDSDHAILDVTLRGVTGRKMISRQLFGPVNEALGLSIADMWWGGAAQDGWGIAVLQQQASLFIVWFTYDEAGKVTWFVVPAGLFVEPGVWQGKVYRAAGSTLLAYDASRFSVTDIGTLRFRFTGLSTGVVEYTLDGQTGSMPVSRQGF